MCILTSHSPSSQARIDVKDAAIEHIEGHFERRHEELDEFEEELDTREAPQQP